jgi:hypothetical protein
MEKIMTRLLHKKSEFKAQMIKFTDQKAIIILIDHLSMQKTRK